MVNLNRLPAATETNRVSKCSQTTVYSVIVGPLNICSFSFLCCFVCFLAFHMRPALQNFLTEEKKTNIKSMHSRHAVKLKQRLAMVFDFSIRLQANFAPEDTLTDRTTSYGIKQSLQFSDTLSAKLLLG